MIAKLIIKKRGQVANQVFIYMLAAILFGLVLTFGTKAILNIKEKADYIDAINFKNEMESAIDGIAPTQDRQTKTFTVPDKYRQVVFLDMTFGGENNCGNHGTKCSKVCNLANPKLPRVICDAWESNLTQTVFTIPIGEIPIKTTRIEPINSTNGKPGYLIVNVTGGKLKLVFRGKGDRTQVMLPD